jgi:glyoxylase-like metal-dependent hydrolase (beta-lactamase superfamily II)
MRELRPGLWHWTSLHPQWSDEDDEAGHAWGPEVSSYAFVLNERVLLIDPTVPDGGLGDLAAGREVVSVLTCPWHARDALEVGGLILAPPPETDGRDPVASQTYAAGDRPLPGLVAFAGLEPMDLVLWVEDYRALVFGDTLVDLGTGLELPDDWGPSDISHADVRRSLRSLLDLPIELVLPTHGAPTDRAAFESAIV